MGNCLNTQVGNKKDNVLSAKLAQMNAIQRDIMKLLLLGAGDSGKTTIFKQMRYIYGGGYSDERRKEMRKPIFTSLVKHALEVCQACGKLPGTEPIQSESSLKAIDYLKSIDLSELELLDSALVDAVSTLWEDSAFQTGWDNRSKIQVMESFGTFCKKLKRYPEWGGNDWIPGKEDFLLARIRSTGVVEEEFRIGGARFRIIDVGGQRNERRKWIHSFAGVTAVLFIAASSEYDQFLFEEQTKNRLVETLDLFETMANSKWFSQTTMILFLNKADLLEEKLVNRRIPLNVSGEFPDAPDTFELREAVSWLEQKFFERLSAKNRGQFFFPHLTTALDEANVKVVLEACKKTILKDTLRKLNFYP
mmetsp:Transcript_12770/g.14655  ORF Transcript_12770/g.14655 Transcript_12770/m.14655 type:complete len:363 (-) Transcript_12770:1337-2425(-)